MTTENKTTEPPKEEGPRSFSVFVAQMADGDAEREASHQLHELCKTMQEQAVLQNANVSGALALKLKFDADEKGVVEISFEVSVTEPKKRHPRALFFLTKGGNLTPENPRQQKLPLRDVSAKKPAEAREVPMAAVAGEVE